LSYFHPLYRGVILRDVNYRSVLPIPIHDMPRELAAAKSMSNSSIDCSSIDPINMENSPSLSRSPITDIRTKDGNPNWMKDSTSAIKGSYALVIQFKKPCQLTIGRLGQQQFSPGFYIYTGSALGSGGIRARVQRHLRYTKAKPAHWHVDRLLVVGNIIEVWWKPGTQPMECPWAARLAAIGSIHIPGFGASDCRCPGHLMRFEDRHEISAGFRFLGSND